MLLTYRTSDGQVLDNTGTSSAAPLGPPDHVGYINTDARGIGRAGLALLRLHDIDDATDVQLALTRQVRVVDGQLVDAGAFPEIEPEPSVIDRLGALEVEVRGMKGRAAAEAAKSTTTAKGVAAAIAADGT